MRTLRPIAAGLAAILLCGATAFGSAGIATFKKDKNDPNGMNAKDFFGLLDGSLGKGDFNSLILVFGGCFTADFTNGAKASAAGKSGKPVAVLAATASDSPNAKSGGTQNGGSFVQGVLNGFDPSLTLDNQPGTTQQAFDGGKARVERDEKSYTEKGATPPVSGQKPTFTPLGKGEAVRLGKGASSYHAILFVGVPKTIADWNDLKNTYLMLKDLGFDIKAFFGSGYAKDGSPALMGDDDQPGTSALQKAKDSGQDFNGAGVRIEAATHENLKKALKDLAAIAAKGKDEQYLIWAADHSTSLAMADPGPRLPPGQALASAHVNLDPEFVALARERDAGRPEVVIDATGVSRKDLTVSLNGNPIGALDPEHDGEPQGVP
ncbi:MAG TPA: hypothetical protein VIY96_09810, partial [Thermoanaerobaculia bacterium]